MPPGAIAFLCFIMLMFCLVCMWLHAKADESFYFSATLLLFVVIFVSLMQYAKVTS